MTDNASNSWEEFLRSLLGPQGAEEALQAMREAGLDPQAMGQAAQLPSDPAQLHGLLAQLQSMIFSSDDSAMREKLARDVAQQTAQSGEASAVMASQEAQYLQAMTAADLWLDAVTDVAPTSGPRDILTPVRWSEAVWERFNTLAEPVAEAMTQAMINAMNEQLGKLGGGEIPPELAQFFGGNNPFGGDGGQDAAAGRQGAGATGSPDADEHDSAGPFGGFPGSILRGITSTAFSAQLGQAVGTLAREVFGYLDIGLPLAGKGRMALLPHSVETFAADLDVPFPDVLHYLAVREAAAARLYSCVPWLEDHVLMLVRAYASHIRIDTDAINEAVHSIDPTDPDAIREAMGSGVFAMTTTPEQDALLAQLETILALIDGWVDTVSEQACRAHVPTVYALQEMLRRRRVTGGPAEHVFATLVGMRMRPARLREASELFRELEREHGVEARDAFFSHPDHLPQADGLADPQAWLQQRFGPHQPDAFDAGLEELLAGTLPFHEAARAHDEELREREGEAERGGSAESDDDGAQPPA
ncbi:MAG: zinc-dependent metalloprotease [Bowdeniella nasicola]|nr:zinc-dependent metalloprotease [Bowdeniella nasicola]